MARPESRRRAAAVVSHSVRDRRAVTDAAGAANLLVNPSHAAVQVLVATPAASVGPGWVSRFVPATGASNTRSLNLNTRRLKPALYNASMIASCNAGLTVVIALLSGVGCTRLVSSAT